MAPFFTGLAKGLGGYGFGRLSGGEVSLPISATGGTKTIVGSYTVHTFTSGSSTFEITSGAGLVEYIIVAGGGGGYHCTGNQNCGGGGAGGLLSNHPSMPSPLRGSSLPLGPGSYPVVVGAGGRGGFFGNSQGNPGDRGGNSNFWTIIAAGGGTDGIAPDSSRLEPGGSGAGGFAAEGGGTGNTPPTSPPQGNPGGAGLPYNNPLGSGGGGAGGSGNPGGAGGLGGAGIALDFPGAGTPVTYAQGGNGSSRPASPTSANTGNGGYSLYTPGSGVPGLPRAPSGAPGIVIIRYLT